MGTDETVLGSDWRSHDRTPFSETVERLNGLKARVVSGIVVGCMHRMISLGLFCILCVGCIESKEENTTSDPIASLAFTYVNDAEFRRDVLDASFVNPNNDYAQLRASQYTEDKWGHLAVWNPPTQPVIEGQHPRFQNGSTIDVESVPWTSDALKELGEYAFFNYPGQINQALHLGIQNPEEYGLDLVNGRVDALVWVTTSTGYAPAVTCASCHSRLNEDGVRIAGRPNDQFDYGAMIEASSRPGIEAGSWGPGRVDVTGDGQYNPTAITDLRPVSFQNYLHRAGTLHNGLGALAVRIETLMITSRGQRYRPPRKIAFALAYYLWTLAEDLPDPDWTHPGADIFKTYCAGCHAGDELVGTRVPLDVIGTPSAVGTSPERGTGYYRIPSLRGVGDREPLFSDGSVPDLDALLDPQRRMHGHQFGLTLTRSDREHLLRFLRTL